MNRDELIKEMRSALNNIGLNKNKRSTTFADDYVDFGHEHPTYWPTSWAPIMRLPAGSPVYDLVYLQKQGIYAMMGHQKHTKLDISYTTEYRIPHGISEDIHTFLPRMRHPNVYLLPKRTGDVIGCVFDGMHLCNL